jgi:hypothetical protein
MPPRADYGAAWLVALAEAGAHRINTIRSYKSALHHTFAVMQTLDDSRPNPFEHQLFKRLLTGMANSKSESERAARAIQPSCAPLKFPAILSLRAHHRASNAKECMQFAAMSLGVAGALRPSELLGSKDHPGRALRAEQIKFYSDEVELHPARGGAPSYCEVTLDVSKTDQQRRGKSRLIAAPCAVSALWDWYRISGATGPSTLFQHGGVKLTLSALLARIRRCLPAIGMGHLHITGKCFRKGGASTLAECGVAAADIASFAWAEGSNTWSLHYANHPEVKRARKLHIARQMQRAVGAL